MSTNRVRRVLFWFALLVVLLFVANLFFPRPRSEAGGDLIINEFVAVNTAGLTDRDGDYSDWIEIYNRSSQPVNLSGWALTDDPQQLEKWTFPNISLDSHHYLVVFASSKDRRSNKAGTELHTNFKLDGAGEFLGLYNVPEGRLMDSLAPHYPEQFNNVSYGRVDDNSAFNYLAHPTPGAPNDPTLAWTGRTAPASFRIARGFFKRFSAVVLGTNTPGAVIYFAMVLQPQNLSWN